MTPTDPFSEHEAATIRQALEAEADGIEARDTMLDGIRGRTRHRRGGRLPWLPAAAALLLAVLGIGGLLLGGDDDERVDVADGTRPDPGPPATDPDPTAAPDTTAPPGDREELPPRPDVLVGVTEDGRLVVIDVDTGEEVRELWSLDDPTQPDPPEGGHFAITGVALHPDGRHVFVETCCEPAAGSIYTVAIDGSTGQPDRATHTGYGMDVSADGRWLAAMSGSLLLLHDLDGGPTRSFDLGDLGFEITRVAVNANGTEVTGERVLERGDDFRTLRSEGVVLRPDGDEVEDQERFGGEGERRAFTTYGRLDPGLKGTYPATTLSVRSDGTGAWVMQVDRELGVLWFTTPGRPPGWVAADDQPTSGQVPWQGLRLVDAAW
jgi:hypothetical protein